MWALLTAAANLPFVVALGVMLVIAVVEVSATLLGGGLSDALDSLLPDIDAVGDVDSGTSAFSRLLGWLHVGRVPILMLLVVFLTVFGLGGLILQSSIYGVFGGYLPTLIAAPLMLIASLPMVRIGGAALSAVMPKDETDAVSEQTFIGRMAVITLGEASAGSPAEAKLTDEHGLTHYLMVEPDTPEQRFAQGVSVLITEHTGAVFKAILNDRQALTDSD